MATLQSELRQAIRSLRHGGSSTAAAFLTLALGLGLTTALIAVIDGVLLRPLPYPDSEQLVLVSEHRPGATSRIGGIVSAATVAAWRGSRTVEGPAAYSNRGYLWTTPEGADRVSGGQLSPGVLPILRVQPFLGRFFHQSEEEAGQDGVVILSHGFWMERFGGRADAIGTHMRLDDRDYEIVGVTPPGFAFPTAEARLWTPQVRFVPTPNKPEVRVFPAIARLRPGASIEQATAEGTAAARGVSRSFIDDLLFGKGGPMEVQLVRMLDEAVSTVKPALVAVAAGVVLLLLVACANVANLLLAAGVARRRELAVRAALGASRAQLLRLMLIEHAALAAAGLGAGWFIAMLLVDALPLVAPAGFPRLDGVAVTGRVMLASGGAAAVAVLLAGLLPAWRGSRGQVSAAAQGRRRALGRRNQRPPAHHPARRGSRARAGAASWARCCSPAASIACSASMRGYDATNVLTARIEMTGPAEAAGCGGSPRRARRRRAAPRPRPARRPRRGRGEHGALRRQHRAGIVRPAWRWRAREGGSRLARRHARLRGGAAAAPGRGPRVHGGRSRPRRTGPGQRNVRAPLPRRWTARRGPRLPGRPRGGTATGVDDRRRGARHPAGRPALGTAPGNLRARRPGATAHGRDPAGDSYRRRSAADRAGVARHRAHRGSGRRRARDRHAGRAPVDVDRVAALLRHRHRRVRRPGADARGDRPLRRAVVHGDAAPA